MARFVPDSAHPFLTPAARALEAPALEIYADEAENVLGITSETAVADDKVSLITGAVARQISTLVEFDPTSVLLESESRGARSKTFRANALPLNPLAKAAVDAALGLTSGAGARYGAITSQRGRTLTPEQFLPDSTEFRS